MSKKINIKITPTKKYVNALKKCKGAMLEHRAQGETKVERGK